MHGGVILHVSRKRLLGEAVGSKEAERDKGPTSNSHRPCFLALTSGLGAEPRSRVER